LKPYPVPTITKNDVMIDVKYNIKDLVSNIYECQKKIIINRRFIRELETEGQDCTQLKHENDQLENRILSFQRELRNKYHFAE
jgi:uncharacterized protein YigA (DUF484 family)